MNNITAESVICAAWDQFFQNGLIADAWNSGLGLRFNVEVRIINHGYERDGNTHHPEWERDFFRSLQYVVTAKHEVFLRKRDGHGNGAQELHDPAQWVNVSNHDSCWRSDGLQGIWETLAEGNQYCWGHVPDEHQKSMLMMNAHCSVNTRIFDKSLIQLVRVQTDRDQARHSWRKLVSCTPARFIVMPG